MNVLFFARLFNPHIGGVEKHVFEVGKILTERGHKVTVITENYQNLPAKSEIEGIKIVRISTGKEGKLKKFRIWRELWKHRDLIDSADIVHCHDVFFWYLSFKFIFPSKKVYTTFHGYEANEIPTKKAILMHKIAEKLSRGNICIGNFFKKWYGTKATIISYGAVDKKIIKQDLKLVKQDKDAVFIGRLESETGILEYLKALNILKNKKIYIQLDVFGDGVLRKTAEKYASENNLKVYFKGFISNVTDYIPHYKYVFVSRYLGILEAMALRKPVFAEYNNSIKKDYLQMTPFSSLISISKNEDEISENLKNYLLGKEKINIEKAYDWAKGQTWEKLAQQYLSLWDL